MQTTYRPTEPSTTPGSVDIFTIHAHTLDTLWHHAEPHIARACARTHEHTPAAIRERIAAKTAQCWCAARAGVVIAVCVTSVSGTRCNVWLCAGNDLALWVNFLYSHIEPWAKRQGCERMTVIGRPGWLKKLAGYRVTTISMEKELNGDSLH